MPPEPRRIIKKRRILAGCRRGKKKAGGATAGCIRSCTAVDGWSAAGSPLQEYESEADYLRRLGLLLPGEEEAMNDLKQGGDHNDR